MSCLKRLGSTDMHAWEVRAQVYLYYNTLSDTTPDRLSLSAP